MTHSTNPNPLKQVKGISSQTKSLDDITPTGTSKSTLVFEPVDDPAKIYFNSIGAGGIRPTEPEEIKDPGEKK